MATLQPVHTFDSHTGRVFSLAVCSMPDGRKWAASASHDRTVRIWCINSLEHRRTIQYTDFVWRVFIVKLPRPCVVAFISAESKIQVSDLETGETVSTHYGRLIFSGNVSLFPKPIIITAEGEEDVSFVDIMSGEKLKTIRGGFDKMFRAVVTNGPEPMLVFTTWNTQTRRSTIQTYDLIDNPRGSEPPTPTTGDRKSFFERQEPDAKPSSSQEFDTLAPPNAEQYSVETARASPAFMSERSSLSSKEKMTLMFEGDSRDGVTSLVITVGDSTPKICSGHYDFMVRLWSVESKELLMVLEGHNDYVGAVAAWKGPQPIVVSGSSDGTIKAWNTQTGVLVATGEGHTRDAWALGVTSEPAAMIVSGSFDRTVRVWDLNPVLLDLNWARRRDFCLFLSRLGYCGQSNWTGDNNGDPGQTCISDMTSATKHLAVVGAVEEAREVLTQKVFCSPPLYRTIASYL